MSAGRTNEEKTTKWKEEEAARRVAEKNLAHGRIVGDSVNIMLLIEEMSELTKALCKLRRFSLDDPTLRTDSDLIMPGITEELADVTLMIDRVIDQMELGKYIDPMRAEKVERTERRLNGEE